MTQSAIDLAVFDLPHIREQWGELPEETYREILAIFIDEAETMRSAASDALADMDRAELARVAHGLRGASTNMGALHLGSCAGTLEAACPTESPESLATHLAALDAAWREVRAVVAAGGPDIGWP